MLIAKLMFLLIFQWLRRETAPYHIPSDHVRIPAVLIRNASARINVATTAVETNAWSPSTRVAVCTTTARTASGSRWLRTTALPVCVEGRAWPLTPAGSIASQLRASWLFAHPEWSWKMYLETAVGNVKVVWYG